MDEKLAKKAWFHKGRGFYQLFTAFLFHKVYLMLSILFISK